MMNDPFGDGPPYEKQEVVFPIATKEEEEEREYLEAEMEIVVEAGMSAHCMGRNAYDAMNEACREMRSKRY